MRKANKNLYLVRTKPAISQEAAADSENRKPTSQEKRKAENSDEVQS